MDSFQSRAHRSVTALPVYSFSLTHTFHCMGLQALPHPRKSHLPLSWFTGWHPTVNPNLRVCDVTFESVSCLLPSQPFYMLVDSHGFLNSIYRIRHLRSGKIDLHVDTESKIYLKPNKINEARMRLLLGI